VGLVSCGNIGGRLLEMPRPFDVKTQIYDPYIDAAQATSMGAKTFSLEELLKTSDIVSIHCPLNESTRHLISETQLSLMKPSALIVNISRGAVVDNDALARALEDGVIRAAALDVTEQEPLPVGHPPAQTGPGGLDSSRYALHRGGFSNSQARW
jgi:D-3-phosphoglycerate dehydrogenase